MQVLAGWRSNSTILVLCHIRPDLKFVLLLTVGTGRWRAGKVRKRSCDCSCDGCFGELI